MESRSEVCFFSAWDFHLSPEQGWQLIECNDNGSGFLFAGLINRLFYEVSGMENERELEPPLPPLPGPLTACGNERRVTLEQMFNECTDKLRTQGAFDRLSECNTGADQYQEYCWTECLEKGLTQSSQS